MKFSTLCKQLNILKEGDEGIFDDVDQAGTTPPVGDEGVASPADKDFDVAGMPSANISGLSQYVSEAEEALKTLKSKLGGLSKHVDHQKTANNMSQQVLKILAALATLKIYVEDASAGNVEAPAVDRPTSVPPGI